MKLPAGILLTILITLTCTLYTKVQPAAAQPELATKQPTPSPSTTLPSHTFNINGKDHKIYFTFDDHPTSHTKQYLDVLKKYNLKATFFIVAYPLYNYLRMPKFTPAVRAVEIMKRAIAEGHYIGNHSVSHSLMCSLTKTRIVWEIGNSQVWIKQFLGIEPKLWRPPHGHLCPSVQNVAAQYGLTTVMWDVDDFSTSGARIMWILRQRASRGANESIVLFHQKIEKLRDFLSLLIPTSKNSAQK